MGIDVDFAMPFDGDTSDGDPGEAGPYTAAEHSQVWRYGLSHLENADNRGPARDVLNEWDASAVAASLVIRVASGGAFVRGVFALSTDNKDVTVPANTTGAARRDMVVLRRNAAVATQTLQLVVLTGSAAAYPTPQQDLGDAGIFEVPLWKWETPNGASDLVGVTFIDLRDWANLPRVVAGELTNNSGADLITGSVVIQDTGAANGYDTTVVVGDADTIGVTIGGEAANGAIGRVAFNGIVEVRTTGVVAIGDPLQTSATAGVAQSGIGNSFGVALTASAGGLATVWALIGNGNFPALPQRAGMLHHEATVVVGNPIAYGLDANQYFNGFAFQNPAAQNDAFTHSFWLRAGTYTLYVLGVTSNTRAIVTWSIDGVVQGTQDWYSVGVVYNVEMTTAITVIGDGYHVLRGDILNRNGASVGWNFTSNEYWIKPASD